MSATPQLSTASEILQPSQVWLDRRMLIWATMGICAINGIAAIAIKSIDTNGLANAASSTFDVSVIVLIGTLVGLKYAGMATEYVRASPLDSMFCGLCLLLSLVPVGHTSWLALSIVCIYALNIYTPTSSCFIGARILLAVTVPVFWARVVFSFFAPTLLGIDAQITGMILGSPVSGNLVEFADRSGYFQIYPACSSFGNISLALLGLWTVTSIHGLRSVVFSIAMGCALSLSVCLVNITRLAAIGLFPKHFDLIHGSTGSSIAGGLAMLLVVAFCWLSLGKRPR